MRHEFVGQARVFGDHIDTDMIIPSRFLVTGDERELGRHAFIDSDPDFARRVAAGDILIAGKNFGCGSLREHAPLAIRGAGIACIVAESFARTFYRNCINRGLYAIELPGVSPLFSQGNRARVSMESATVTNLDTGASMPFVPYPAFISEICDSGGLFSYIEKKLGQRTGRETIGG